MRQAFIDEFSYASETHSLGRILAIRAVESMSGQPYLKKLYRDYQSESHKTPDPPATDKISPAISLAGCRVPPPAR